MVERNQTEISKLLTILVFILLTQVSLGSISLNTEIITSWEETSPNSSPQERDNMGFIFVPGINKTLLFGGNGATQYYDMWTYDVTSNTWDEISTTNQPELTQHATAYDQQNQKIVTFGGRQSGSIQDKTYTFDYTTNNWTQQNPDIKPSPRVYTNMVYDPIQNKLILFGGQYLSGTVYGDTWSYDYVSDNWTQLFPEVSPPARSYFGMDYNPISQKILIFGGYDNKGVNSQVFDDVWEYSVSENNWTQITTTGNQPAAAGIGFAYDSTNSGFISFRGNTWFLNATDYHFTNYTSSHTNPISRSSYNSLVYDRSKQTTILFGGYDNNGNYVGDTWEFNMTVNKPKTVDTTPIPTSTSPPTTSSSNKNNTSFYFVETGIICIVITLYFKRRIVLN